MAIPIYTTGEIDAVERAVSIAESAIGRATEFAVPGVTTRELDERMNSVIEDAGATAPFRRVEGLSGRFPAATCISVNEEAAHGVPADRTLAEGDLVVLDAGVEVEGFHADRAEPLVIGAGDRALSLRTAAIDVTSTTVRALQLGGRWSAAAIAARAAASDRGVTVLGEFTGHGLGRALHEEPRASFHPSAARSDSPTDFVLRPGMVFTIEPVVVEGDSEPGLVTLSDGWSVVTADRRWSCYQEVAVAVGEAGVRVLGFGLGPDPR
ncbi:MAG: type I methionyl aminopeptidase [Planctomycetota bacterium]